MSRIVSFVLLIVATLGPAAAADQWLAWSELDNKSRQIDIYLSHEGESETDTIHQITYGGKNIVSSILETTDMLWLAWVDRSNMQRFRLRYARFDPHRQTLLESGMINTSDPKIYGPSLGVGPKGKPMVAWSGVTDQNEEIRVASFEDGRWSAEQKITDNDYLDNMPRLLNRDEQTVLQWGQFNDSGYSVLEVTLNDDTSQSMHKPVKPGSKQALTAAESPERPMDNMPFQVRPSTLPHRKGRFLIGVQTPPRE